MGRIVKEIAVIEVVTYQAEAIDDEHALFVVNLNGIK